MDGRNERVNFAKNDTHVPCVLHTLIKELKQLLGLCMILKNASDCFSNHDKGVF